MPRYGQRTAYGVEFSSELEERLSALALPVLCEARQRLGVLCQDPDSAGPFRILRVSDWRLMVQVDRRGKRIKVLDARGPSDP